MTATVWLLNLDGDAELAATGQPRDPFAALERRPELEVAFASLVAGGSILRRGERVLPGTQGVAFCPTPSARAALERAGARVWNAPDAGLLRRVADRRFALALPGGVSGALAVTSVAEAAAAMAGATGTLVLKRLWSFAGRGRRLVRAGALAGAELRFVERALAADGALVVEPWLPRCGDFALHGFVPPGGAVTLGDATVQTTTTAGGWVATRLAAAGDLPPPLVHQLTTLARDAGRALASVGFFGPFGVDAVRWTDPERKDRLCRCEINPRYTMGWAVGMAGRRPDLAHPGKGAELLP